MKKETNNMKKMSISEQMQTNGGAYTHCHDCGRNFSAPTEKQAINAVLKHREITGHYWWDFGRYADCPNK